MQTPMRLKALLIAAFMLFCTPELSVGRVVILDAAAVANGSEMMLTLRLSDRSQYRLQTLQSPYRLVIDLPPVDWLMPPARLNAAITACPEVRSMRHGWFRPGTYRIVLDLDGPVVLQQPSIVSHATTHTLSIAWQRTGHFNRQELGKLSDLPIPKPRPAQADDRQKPLIVLDPGHGGVDPGAIGALGTQEKDITLRAATILAAQLRLRGYEVRLTRSSDRFLKLRERVEIARRAKADLFISLHADSAGSDRAQGLSVYSLSENASDRTAEALARRENKADLIAGVDLSDEEGSAISVLIDLAQRETINRSVRFANQLVQSAATRVPILSRAHRHAGFAVLKAPDTPAVLIELGFLSNPDEEQLLDSAFHLTQVALGISAAVDNYFADRWARRQ